MSNRSPAAFESDVSEDSAQAERLAACSKQAVVLFVDDDPNLTSSVVRALRRYPYRIECANSADAALELLRTRQVDVIVSDEQMPGMSGTAFLAEARRLYPTITRVLLTGKASLDSAIRAINEGEIFRLVTKPCDSRQLSAVLSRAVQHRQLMVAARRLLEKSKEQSALLVRLEHANPELTQIKRDDDGAVVMDETVASLEDLLDALER